MPAYNANKAALFNQLRQSGISEDAAAKQAGITDAESGNYAVGDNGQLGASIAGAGKVAGVDFDRPTAAEPANFEQVDYAQDAKLPTSRITPTNYSTTSTEPVSGGGSTTITAGARQSTPASQALQPAIDAKQAEIQQFNRDNPSNFERKKQGLPPLTAEENQARSDKALALSKEKTALTNQQLDAQAPGTPTVTTVPNTTTTTTTTTSGTTAVETAVQSPGGSDPTINQQTETNLGLASEPGAVGDDNLARNAEVADTGDGSEHTPEGDANLARNAEVDDNEDVQVAKFTEQQDAAADEENLRILEEGDNPSLEVDDSDPAFTGDGSEHTPEGDANLARNAEVDDNEDVQVARFNAQQDVQGIPTGAGGEDAAGNVGSDGAVVAGTQNARASGAIDAQRQLASQSADWRVRISLAPGADYLYKAPGDPGILKPLKSTDGVLFPYTPSIDTSYRATYAQQDLTHSNYRGYFYQNSTVEPVVIKGTFTAQNTQEADYLLAVIHFFRSVTKMFYGKDINRGAPPPLVFLTGLGQHQFNFHPCVVAQFQYSLPDDIDYIRTSSTPGRPQNINTNLQSLRPTQSDVGTSPQFAALGRLINAKLFPGAQKSPGGGFGVSIAGLGTKGANYVPTKMNILVTLNPIQSRESQSKQFSLQNFANGNLLKGGFW